MAIVLVGKLFLPAAEGLPGEYLLTQRWRTISSERSPLTNPAFINEENYLSFRGAYTSILSSFTTVEAGATYPIGLYQSAGFSIIHQGLNSSYVGTLPDGSPSGIKISDNSDYFMGSYAFNIWKGLTLGLNANFFTQSFTPDQTNGVGVDAGLSYRLLQNPVIGSHILGVAVQNGLYVALSTPKETLPMVARLSLVSKYWERRIESTFDFSLKDLNAKSIDFSANSVKSEWDFDGKVGYWALRMFKLYGLLGMTDQGLSYWGVAGGLNLPLLNNGRDLSFYAQYLNSTNIEKQELTSLISMYVQTDVGKHREEIYARKMAKMANIAPNDLYIRALQLYSQENYWDAFFLFSQLFVEYPDFFKNDWVSFFIGSCQEHMDMRLTAENAFKKTKNQYSRSAAVPFSDLGLMRVYYRDGNYSAVESQFNELNKLGVPDSIKYHGYYYMGEAEMKKGNNSKAQQLFDLIPESHPDYVFAQHSSAICNMATDNYEAAISNLENCIQTQTTQSAQKEITYRSYVFLGYIFYEELTQQEGPLAKAVTAFRMVPKSSHYYADALLGLSWTALKARQWNDCMSAGQELTSISSDAIVSAEGALLQAYTHMMQKNYNAAATLLSNASQNLDAYQPPSSSEMATRESGNSALRSQYTVLARKAYDLGTSRQSDIVIKTIDSLSTNQKKYKNQIDDYLMYVDSYQRSSLFARNFESVKEDIDYALAKAQKIGGQVKQTETIQEFQKDQKKIDQELEKLRQQLEKEENKSQE